ncbi:MAG TPA: electron transfer flavoprotein subunit alpha/FixB family protein [Gemmatimonadales bacterium]|nr:electron transfer flavoprotein subunit alpha/FixB family protein [Gemmatimonadales bacterium]
MSHVLVVIEQRDGAVKRVSFEALTVARSLANGMGARVAALVIGPAVDTGALGRFGADHVVRMADAGLALYQPAGYTAAVTAQAVAQGAVAVVLSATALGKDLGPRVAARLECALAADVTEVEYRDGAVEVRRPVYAGKAVLRLRVTTTPCVITLRPNAVTAIERPAQAVESHAPAPSPAGAGALTVAVKEAPGARLDVAEASIIVSGGRGLKDPTNFALLEDLAGAIGGAAVGASRAVVDAGWRPHADQVGQTGKTVSPNLYIAVGISGAIQHVAGMRSAKVIVAINKDKDAPIFKIADYGIVGDLFAIVPRLTQEIKKLRAG